MTQEQIATWHQQARDNLFARKSIISQRDILTEFARIVSQDTWARAAKVCEQCHDWQTINNQEYPSQWHDGIDAAINALRAEAAKDPKP